jgi:hypothetical protein
MAGTGSPAQRQQANLGGQGPRNTKVSVLVLVLVLVRFSAREHWRVLSPIRFGSPKLQRAVSSSAIINATRCFGGQ